jgi:hypothetical protein
VQWHRTLGWIEHHYREHKVWIVEIEKNDALDSANEKPRLGCVFLEVGKNG